MVPATMRVALCQTNPTVGDYRQNAATVVREAQRAHEQGAELAVFSELVLCGYPPRDLLDRDRFTADGLETLDRIASEVPSELTVLVGAIDRSSGSPGRGLHNAVAVIRGGRVERMIAKRLLPTYDVFDEERYFDSGPASEPVEIAGRRVGITICEDIWNDAESALAQRRYRANPIEDLRALGVDLVVNLSASPFTLPKREGRPAMLSEVARRSGVPLVFVNQVGGNDDLLFDGDSSVFGPDGSTRARLARFEEDFAVVDLDGGEGHGPRREQPGTNASAALAALTMGTRDYARKCGFERAIVGLSGGIDSALTACIAARALGPDRVQGVAMPTRYSSASSSEDAEALARALGIGYRVIPIDEVFQSYIDHLGPHLDALGRAGERDVTFENVQARIRGNVLMALSNRLGSLLLTTGNKSEIAVGYCTLYGDMAGGLAVISDLPKTLVYEVAREINRQAGDWIVPESTLDKAPSAELAPDQKDSDSLPDYAVLDVILRRYVEEGASVADLVADGHDRAVVEEVVRMMRRSEYKRRQMPPGLIVTRKAFGPGRRYPIAQRYDG